jgi:hypothetical protein
MASRSSDESQRASLGLSVR